MFGQEFENNLIRKYVAVFGTVFNDIYITRSKNGEVTQRFQIPIRYGPREKYLAMVKQKPNDKRVAAQFPRMSFQIMSLEPDVERKFPRTNQYRAGNEKHYEAKAWNIHFQLSIMAKTEIDATRIVEQILYYFDPDFTVGVNLIEGSDRTWDIPITLVSTSNDELYEGNFEERRMILWTLDFTMKAWLLGPAKEAKVIKFIKNNFYTPTALTQRLEIRPGLTEDGRPTKDPDESIHYLDINAGDNYDYIETFEDFPDDE